MAEALWVSCRLRFTSDVDDVTARAFVDEVMDLVELEPIKGSLVGVPGLTGLSVEQRKRLTIAVELVANPSIVFMDVRPCLPASLFCCPPLSQLVCRIMRPSQEVQGSMNCRSPPLASMHALLRSS